MRIKTGKQAWGYILANANNTTLYVGQTDSLVRRIHQHRSGIFKNSFTRRYNLVKLVWFRTVPNVIESFKLEKHIKHQSRQYKEELINSINPEWDDLADTLPSSW